MLGPAARALALALLLFTGGAGIYNGVNELGDVETGLQAVVTAGVFAYGVFGLASFVVVVRRWRSAGWLVVPWGIALTLVATLAPLAYGGPDVPLVGALAGGLATALLAYGTWWVTIRRTRPASSAAPVSR